MVTDTYPPPRTRYLLPRIRSEKVDELRELYNIGCDLLGNEEMIALLIAKHTYKMHTLWKWMDQNEKWIIIRIHELDNKYN